MHLITFAILVCQYAFSDGDLRWYVVQNTDDPLETAKSLSRCWNAFTTTSIPPAVTTTTFMKLHVIREPYWVHITHSWVCGFKIPAQKLI